jgi:hypothetical protein
VARTDLKVESGWFPDGMRRTADFRGLEHSSRLDIARALTAVRSWVPRVLH